MFTAPAMTEQNAEPPDHHASGAALTAQFVCQMKRLDTRYVPIRTQPTWMLALILQIHHASIVLLAGVVREVWERHSTTCNKPVDVRWDSLREWSLQDLIIQLHRYTQLLKVAGELAVAAESSIGLLRSFLPADHAAPQSIRLAQLEFELRGFRNEIQSRLQGLTEDVQSQLHFMDSVRSGKQSNSLGRLSILAAVFLPLSLATGILGMQSRLSELGYIIYDFFGLTAILIFLVSALLPVISVFARLTEWESLLMGNQLYRTKIRPSLKAFLWSTYVIYWTGILVSFLLGMFKDVNLGLHILWRFVLIGVISQVLSFPFVQLITSRIARLWRCLPGTGRATRPDAEQGRGAPEAPRAPDQQPPCP